MSDELTTLTEALMKDMMEELTRLKEEIDALQSECWAQKGATDDSDDKSEGQGLLVSLLEATKA